MEIFRFPPTPPGQAPPAPAAGGDPRPPGAPVPRLGAAGRGPAHRPLRGPAGRTAPSGGRRWAWPPCGRLGAVTVTPRLGVTEGGSRKQTARREGRRLPGQGAGWLRDKAPRVHGQCRMRSRSLKFEAFGEECGSGTVPDSSSC